MKTDQKNAVNCHLEEIIGDLQWAIEPFFTYLNKKRVISHAEMQTTSTILTNEGKLRVLLTMVQTKDNGWEAMISYLIENKFGVAQKLKDSLQKLRNSTAAAIARPTESNAFAKKIFMEEFKVKNSTNSAVELTPDFVLDFKRKLIRYYTSPEYSDVRTMFDCHKPVKEVWVPLRIEEKTGHPLQNDRFDHFKLLERLADSTASFALVKGQPGMGKTTLIKKIAYDWATKTKNPHNTQTQTKNFNLILTVPLRNVGPTVDFLELTADYYANHLKLCPGDEHKLLGWLTQFGLDLLICLDGLDEYSGLIQSPFKTMFATSFGPSTASFSQSVPSSIPYKLLVTSRPYACELINRQFFPLRFEICLLDEHHLTDFVKLYCVTDEGNMKVRQYLQHHSGLVIKVPLILTFVCYLADLREEIPANLTLLYEKLLGHMLKREIEGNKLSEKVKAEQWKESAVVIWTAQLAFKGCTLNKFEFSPSLDLDVAKDSFTCGFLLHTFNFHDESLNAEFPHRSVQEFFAGLYCYQLTSTTDKSERNSVMEEILNKDSQFGRFFFGLCSVERKKFEEMLDWLNPTFGDVITIQRSITWFLSRLSDGLSDCSDLFGERLGERLVASLDQLENQIQKEREERISWSGANLSLPLSSRTFQSEWN